MSGLEVAKREFLQGDGGIDVRVRHREDLDRAANALGTDAGVDVSRARLALPVTGGPDELITAIRALADAGVALDDIALRRPTLDDVFLALTGHTTKTTENDTDAPREVAA